MQGASIGLPFGVIWRHQTRQPFGFMRLHIASPDRPFGRDVGGHFVEVSLRILDQLRALVPQKTQKYLLGYIVDVGCPRDPVTAQESTQWRAPLVEPLGEAVFRV